MKYSVVDYATTDITVNDGRFDPTVRLVTLRALTDSYLPLQRTKSTFPSCHFIGGRTDSNVFNTFTKVT